MDHELPFSWYNLHDHDDYHHQQQTFNFDSESLFLNQIHQLSSDEMFSDGNSLFHDNILTGTNNNAISVSSGDDDGAISQCSSGKRPINFVGASSETRPKPKRSRSSSSNINFQQPGNQSETDVEAIAQMKEMIYREAAFRPVNFTAETVVDKPKRKNVRISSDPQTVAARQRRERVSERIRVLQKLVPGGNKMDTASMLDEAANYLKFLRSQVKALEQFGQNSTSFTAGCTTSIGVPFSMQARFQFPYENLYHNPPPALYKYQCIWYKSDKA